MQTLHDLLNDYKAACQNFAYAKLTLDPKIMHFDHDVHLLRNKIFSIIEKQPELEEQILNKLEHIHEIASEFAHNELQSISYHWG